MYYHLIMEDGLKYKDLSIEELEKIINEEEVSYNNSRVYSSEKKLNQIFEMYKDDLNEQQNDVNLENIKIEKLISIAERKNDLQNNSYKFFLDIKNPRGKINLMNFLNKTFIIWLIIIISVVKWVLFNNYFLTGEMEFRRFELTEKLLDRGLVLIVIIVFLKDKYFKKEYFVISIIANIVTNILIYISEKLVANIMLYISAKSATVLIVFLLIPIIKIVIMQLVYNYAREKSYREYKDLNTINISINRKLKLF
ncbi:hypothetical protein ABVN58_09920 [Fusobacterium polymorphum]|uniref:Uncharacterized protein n=1 Tax=Fusobacterium nucleatum CTI-6 TaxID=1316587 RepID=U7TWC4_FUSNU|nr:hypothetical protein [Fusobacterium nucleatum]ERT48633.1 hypothetical protein HMPREF1767_00743 [Fusobacterium nucleatum CTI-6]